MKATNGLRLQRHRQQRAGFLRQLKPQRVVPQFSDTITSVRQNGDAMQFLEACHTCKMTYKNRRCAMYHTISSRLGRKSTKPHPFKITLQKETDDLVVLKNKHKFGMS